MITPGIYQSQIVDHCNLNCRSCCTFSPLAKPGFVSVADFARDWSKLACLTKANVEMIGFAGGEPLLHPDLLDLFLITRGLFPLCGKCIWKQRAYAYLCQRK